MSTKQPLPKQLLPVMAAAQKAVAMITPLPPTQQKNYPSNRTDSGRELPRYFLVYFLLVELLEFPAHGPHEKVAWSIPIYFKGKAFAIEHRKMGLGVFARDVATDEPEAGEIVQLIKDGVKAAEPFFDWMAAEAVRQSQVNVVNTSADLYARFRHHVTLYRGAVKTAARRKEEEKTTWKTLRLGTAVTSRKKSHFALHREAQWLALSCIEAFFGWTEHAFIHLALLKGQIKTAPDVVKLADANWAEKFKAALDLKDADTKRLFDQLIEIRRQLRNAIAHGAFGKSGEAFSFHSSAGAVPVLLPHRAGQRKFGLGHRLSFDDDAAIALIEEFIVHLWSGARAPARLYIQESGLPTIMTFVASGVYARALVSEDEMSGFIDYWSGVEDRSIDMEW